MPVGGRSPRRRSSPSSGSHERLPPGTSEWTWRRRMRIVVVGGSGLIGSRLVAMLLRDGRDVAAASRRSGVDVVSGKGLADALKGPSVVVDVTNAPSFEDAAVMKFFNT